MLEPVVWTFYVMHICVANFALARLPCTHKPAMHSLVWVVPVQSWQVLPPEVAAKVQG
jgi:hypothetical protein